MYSHFSMATQLPEIKHAVNFQRCLLLGNYLMLVSLIVVAFCISVTFAFDDHFTMAAQIAAHIATIVFAGALKVGYVLRCVALHAFGVERF